MQTLTLEEVVVKYEMLLLKKQNAHAQLVAGLEDFYQARYEELLEILQGIVEVFEFMAIEDMLTLTETQRQHVALVLRMAWRYLAEVQEG